MSRPGYDHRAKVAHAPPDYDARPRLIPAPTLIAPSRHRKAIMMPTIAKAAATVADAVADAERVQQEAQAAQLAAAAALARADQARAKLEAGQERARREFALSVIDGHPTESARRTAVIADTRATFESAVLTEPADTVPAYLGWVGALMEKHVADEAFANAHDTLQRKGARHPQEPRTEFHAEVDAVVARAGLDLLDAAIARHQDAKAAAIAASTVQS